MALGLNAIVEGAGSPQEEEGDGEAKHDQRWELLGDASSGSSTGNRIYRPVSSLLAYVQQEGSYELRRGRSGPGRRRIRAVVVDS